ncbi:hypothetical protein BGZ63DRAFT_95584 [Mariannaea sp. PMI_226]|nr:hypothetical protein BGZ63DRAFT_95584 [Mariannaea sp. PMI_226]
MPLRARVLRDSPSKLRRLSMVSPRLCPFVVTNAMLVVIVVLSPLRFLREMLRRLIPYWHICRILLMRTMMNLRLTSLLKRGMSIATFSPALCGLVWSVLLPTCVCYLRRWRLPTVRIMA